MNRIQILILSSLGFGLLIATGSFLFNFGEWKQLMFFTLMGMGVGVLVAPIFTPQNFKKPMILQTISGIVAGFLGVYGFTDDFMLALLGSVAGAVIGGTAPFWSKQVEIS